MLELRRILCPIDFSDGSRRAFDHALAIARWYDAAVTALHVFEVGMPPAAVAPGGPLPAGPYVMSPVDRERVAADLSAFVAAHESAGMPVEVRVAGGHSAWRVILEQAEADPADLLVVGTHGRSGFERLILGSVTEKVLRKAPVPVLVIPPGSTGDPHQPPLFKRILCAVDFSKASEDGLAWALSLAKEADADLTLLHVLDLSGFPAHLDLTGQLDAFRLSYEEAARQKLADAVPADANEYCRVDRMLTAGRPYAEILRVAAERHSELIVLGVAGHSAVELAFFGSTTQQVVRAAACPVLTVRG